MIEDEQKQLTIQHSTHLFKQLFHFLPSSPPLPPRLFWPPRNLPYSRVEMDRKRRSSSIYRFIHPSIHPSTRSQQDPLRTILTHNMPLGFRHVARNPCCLRGTISTLQSHDEEIQRWPRQPGRTCVRRRRPSLSVVGSWGANCDNTLNIYLFSN